MVHKCEISLKYLDLGWDKGKASCRTRKREQSLLKVIRKNKLDILHTVKEVKMN